MNILKVKETESSYIINDLMTVPKNSHYNENFSIQEWVSQGGVIEQEDFLAIKKQSKISEVKNACEIFRTSALTVGGKTYKTTDTAKLKFWSLVNGSATGDYPIIWLEVDDISFVSLSKVQATALYDAFEDQDRSAYQQRGVYLSQIEACTTSEEVQAITINFQ